MITKAQIKKLPKGTFPNSDLYRLFPNHGKKHRFALIPTGKKLPNGEPEMVRVLQNRRQARNRKR